MFGYKKPTLSFLDKGSVLNESINDRKMGGAHSQSNYGNLTLEDVTSLRDMLGKKINMGAGGSVVGANSLIFP